MRSGIWVISNIQYHVKPTPHPQPAITVCFMLHISVTWSMSSMMRTLTRWMKEGGACPPGCMCTRRGYAEQTLQCESETGPVTPPSPTPPPVLFSLLLSMLCFLLRGWQSSSPVCLQLFTWSPWVWGQDFRPWKVSSTVVQRLLPELRVHFRSLYWRASLMMISPNIFQINLNNYWQVIVL